MEQGLLSAPFQNVVFRRKEMSFFTGQHTGVISLIHHITCRLEACQALVYQLASGLTGESGKYNYSKAVHRYPPFFDIFCSPKNYKTASALTAANKGSKYRYRGEYPMWGVAGGHPRRGRYVNDPSSHSGAEVMLAV